MKIIIQDKIKKIATDDPKKMAKILQDVLKVESKTDRMKEHFWGIYLNSRLNIITIELISLGTLDASIVHPREVFLPAIRSSAASVIIAHNHPSDHSDPSEGDLIITERIRKAGDILGIEIVDHIIITKKNFYSFKENKIF